MVDKALDPLVVFGAGGMGRETMSALRQFASDRYAPCFAEDAPTRSEWFGCPIIAASDIPAGVEMVIALGDGGQRRNIVSRFDARWPVLALGALIGDDVEIGEGGLICPGAMVTASVRIGRHFQCNVGVNVMHDCVIGDFVTLAPRVQCNGNVHIGDDAYIGSGAIIRNGRAGNPLRIGAGAIVGMGAVVLNDVPAGATVIGNPARAPG